MKTSYRDLDYKCGMEIQKLRKAIGITQAELADRLGVSWRTVAGWEAGSSYPRAEHFKALIALAVQQRAFTVGHEAEEIRVLWKVAHQKTLLDECWLCALLDQRSCSQEQALSLQVEPKARQESMTTALVNGQEPLIVHTIPAPRLDWSDAPAVPIFYEHEQELGQLSQWVIQERCRVVGVLGMGGIGKSVLAVSTMYRVAEHFEMVIFRSLRYAPSCEALLDDCLQMLASPQEIRAVPAGQVPGKGASPLPTPTEQRISLLLSHLLMRRVLIVLDNLESLLHEGDVRGQFRPGFEGYGQLLHLVAETAHQSCLLFTSQEEPTELRTLSGKSSLIHSLHLAALDASADQPRGQAVGTCRGWDDRKGSSLQSLPARSYSARTTGTPLPLPGGIFPQTPSQTNGDQSQRSPVVREEAEPTTIDPYGPRPAMDKTRGRRKLIMSILIALVILAIMGSTGTLFFQARHAAPAQAYPSYLSGNGRLSFFDPLSQEDGSKWGSHSTNSTGKSCQFTKGAYHVNQQPANYYARCLAQGTFSNFAFEAQLTIMQRGCGGMVFRYSDNGHFYYFHVCEDGAYRVYKYVDNVGAHAKNLYSGSSSAFHTGLGHQNKIAVVASGSIMTFYVNEQQITQMQDSSYTSGKIALIATPSSGYATDVTYSNARLWRL
jgi:transcriptional regulator with XRE-family HTH domain